MRSASAIFSLSKKATPIKVIMIHMGLRKLYLAPIYKPQATTHIGQLKSQSGIRNKSNSLISNIPPMANKITPAAVLLLLGVMVVSMLLFIVVSIKLYPKATAVLMLQ